MSNWFRVNRLVYVQVEKADPDKQAYIVRVLKESGIDLVGSSITGATDIIGFLPKRFTVKPLKAGEVVLAAIFDLSGRYPIFSQTSPAFILGYLEIVLAEEKEVYDLIFCRVGWISGAHYCKVGVWGRGGFMPHHFLQSLVNAHKKEFDIIPYPILIPGGLERKPKFREPKPETFIREALRPAPVEEIISFNYEPELWEAQVIVPKDKAPLFVGKNGTNILMAEKLTKVKYQIQGV